MAFFATIRNDIKAIWDRIVRGDIEPLGAQAEQIFKRDVLAALQKVVDYIESKLPEAEAAAVAAVDAAVPSIAPILNVAAPIVEGAVNAEVTKVVQKVDAEAPKP